MQAWALPVFASATCARAQSTAAPALPLKNLGLEHLDILVPDTAVSAKFYMQVFKTKLHQQPFQGNIRYFILLGDLPANRQVGYIAIGAKILASPDERDIIRFLDNNGIMVELKAA